MIKNIILITLGFILIGIGAVGIALPVLPTTPFILLAGTCFSLGNQQLYVWLCQNRIFGQYLENYRSKTGISRALKIGSLSFLWFGLILSMILVHTTRIYIILAIVGICVTVHLLLMKTKK